MKKYINTAALLNIALLISVVIGILFKNATIIAVAIPLYSILNAFLLQAILDTHNHNQN